MPYVRRWVEPECVLDYNDVQVYQSYWDTDDDVLQERWGRYALYGDFVFEDVDPECEFDIADYAHLVGMKVNKNASRPVQEQKKHETILKALIDEGFLTNFNILDKLPPPKPLEDKLTLSLFED